jgi:hypothetical protein
MPVEFLLPPRTGIEIDIAPDLDMALPLQEREVFDQTFQEFFVFASIATKEFKRDGHREPPAFVEIVRPLLLCVHRDISECRAIIKVLRERSKRERAFLSANSR